MARHVLTRLNGIELGRLPNYEKISDPIRASHPKAVAFRNEMKLFVQDKAAIRVNGKQSSDRTIETAVEILCEATDRIWRLGYRIDHIKQIKDEHIRAIVRDYWACGCSPKHLITLMTQLNKFDDWIGKPGLTRKKEYYLPEVNPKEFTVFHVATKSKSWSQNGIDVEQKIKQADELNHRFGLMLRIELAFGLRRCEVLQVKPWHDDRGDRLHIRTGIAKGGRPRDIDIDSEGQREILDYVKSRIGKTEFLGWVDGKQTGQSLLKRNERRYSRYMSSIGITRKDAGVTGHGLRAQYAENAALIRGLLPATLGGTLGQMPKEEENAIRLKVSENLGHGRLNVTNAYYGNLKKKSTGRGHTLPFILLNDQSGLVTYVNPGPTQNPDGSYIELSMRQISTTSILVVLLNLTGNEGEEVGSVNVEIVKGGIAYMNNTIPNWTRALEANYSERLKPMLAKFGFFPKSLLA